MGKGKAKPGDVHGGEVRVGKKKDAHPSTLKKVIFSKGLSAGTELVGESEFGRAPFALAVEYVPPVGDRYGAKLLLIPKDSDVVALIAKHRLRGVPVCVDRGAVAVDERKERLSGELSALTGPEEMGGIWSPRAWWTVVLMFGNWVESLRVVKVSFGTLLDGIEIRGSMEEVRRVVREVTMAIDKLAANLETGSTFDSGETRVFAPGTRTKTVETKSGTPPSEWGR